MTRPAVYWGRDGLGPKCIVTDFLTDLNIKVTEIYNDYSAT